MATRPPDTSVIELEALIADARRARGTARATCSKVRQALERTKIQFLHHEVVIHDARRILQAVRTRQNSIGRGSVARLVRVGTKSYQSQEMHLYELELRRAGRADGERLYEGTPLRLDDVVAIEDAVWRVAEVSTPIEPSAEGRLVLVWAGWRRSEVARARSIELIEESTALVNEARHILKLTRSTRETSPV